MIALTLLILAASLLDDQGVVTFTVDGKSVTKRHVVRYPASWNGKIVIGAHGGSGGERFDLEGKVIGTDETALDDVVGRFAVERGFAYASVDRDGIGGTREGLELTNAFARLARERIEAKLGRKAECVYLVGLSMGGGITRFAAEESPPHYDGVLIIAGAAGDVPTRLDRQAQIATLWPQVQGRPDADPVVQVFSTAIGTPVAARALWPFTAAGSSLEGLAKTLEGYGLTGLSSDQLARFRVEDFLSRNGFAKAVARQNTTGKLQVPAIEVVGTYDDLVLSEIRAYKKKVEKEASGRHRLYAVEGVWHISGDDDAISSFRYITRRRKLGEAIDEAMREGPSYLLTVREALELLDVWVTKGEAPPPDRNVKPGERLKP